MLSGACAGGALATNRDNGQTLQPGIMCLQVWVRVHAALDWLPHAALGRLLLLTCETVALGSKLLHTELPGIEGNGALIGCRHNSMGRRQRPGGGFYGCCWH